MANRWRIIPECGHGVAVVVAHHQPIRHQAIRRRTGRARVFRETSPSTRRETPAVLACSHDPDRWSRPGTIEAKWVGRPVSVKGIQGIRIVVEQPVGITVHRRRSLLGDKARLS